MKKERAYQRTAGYPYEKKKINPGRWIRLLFLFFFIYWLINNFLISGYRLTDQSMQPGLIRGARVLVSQINYGLRLPLAEEWALMYAEPQRGDLVLSRHSGINPDDGLAGFFDSVCRFFTLQQVGFYQLSGREKPANLMVRRVAALPGDQLKFIGNRLQIKTDASGSFQKESELINGGYRLKIDSLPFGWSDHFPLSGNSETVTVPEGCYFLLADDRSGAGDSRHWGVVTLGQIYGKVLTSY